MPDPAVPIGPAVTLRRMTPADVAFAMELKNLAGWNQTERDWQGYLAFEPDGCFVAERAGRPAGTATSLRYGPQLGWIGMVLVHPRARRCGIGTRLLRCVIEHLQERGTVTIKLDATDLGKKVYVPLGFRDEFELSRFEGVALPVAGAMDSAVQALRDEDLAAVVNFDAPRFGVPRPAVLRSLAARNPEWCLVCRARTGIAGYLLAREGHAAVQLGPWVALDSASAAALLDAFLLRASGRRVLVDTPHPNIAGGSLLRSRGFVVQRTFTRMHLGPNLSSGVPTCVYGGSGAEKG